MSNLSLSRGRRAETIGLVTAAATGTSIISNATTATEGAWTTIGSFSQDMNAFLLHVAIGRNVSTIPEGSIDVALGDGSTTLASDLYFDHAARPGRSTTWYFPLRVPANVPVVLRLLVKTTASLTYHCAMTGMSETPMGLGGYTKLYPVNVSGASQSTAVDPGATAHTKGTTTSLTTGGLAEHIKGFYVQLVKRATTSLAANTRYYCDIMDGTGVLVNDLWAGGSSGEDNILLLHGPFYSQIAKGTPISARLQCSNNTATLRLCDVIFHALV